MRGHFIGSAVVRLYLAPSGVHRAELGHSETRAAPCLVLPQPNMMGDENQVSGRHAGDPGKIRPYKIDSRADGLSPWVYRGVSSSPVHRTRVSGSEGVRGASIAVLRKVASQVV